MQNASVLYASGIDTVLCATHSSGMISADDISAARARVAESQAAFGERFGVDQSTIHRWETAGPPKKPLVQDGIRRVLETVQMEANASCASSSGCAREEAA